jgi:hypothetical protein
MWLKSSIALIAIIAPLLQGGVALAPAAGNVDKPTEPVKVNQPVVTAPPRDAFIGTWVGECGEGYQCEVTINQSGARYTFVLLLANWQDVSDVVCRISGTMDLSKDGSYLAGQMGSSPLSGVFLRGRGSIELHDVPDLDCGRPYALDGLYRILGD